MIILRTVIGELARAYFWILIIYIVLSWFPSTGSTGGALVTVRDALGRVTEPLLTPVRRIIPPFRLGGMALDLSPIIVLVVLQVVFIRVIGGL